MEEEYFDIDNMYCGIVRRGDVVIYSDAKHKQLALLVLQDDILNETVSTVVCALIVHKDPERPNFLNEVLLQPSETGLSEDALCLSYKIGTFDRRGIIMKKGELRQKALQEVLDACDVTFGKFRDELIH